MNQSLEAANISPMQAEDGVNGERPTPLLRGGWRDYLAIARFDHTTKHVFIIPGIILAYALRPSLQRSEEHTSELQSLMRISYAVFCLKKKKTKNTDPNTTTTTKTHMLHHQATYFLRK